MSEALKNIDVRDTLATLIRREFDNIDFSQEYIYDKATPLIEASKACYLFELAEEMKNDKLIY